MKRGLPGLLVPLAAAICAGLVLFIWLAGMPRVQLPARIPGTDRPSPGASAEPAAGPRGQLETGPGQPAAIGGAWPGFRGPNRDGVSSEAVRLATTWGAGGPPALWKIELGEGYAGPAVQDGRVYVLDFDAAAQADVVRCLSLADGKDIWRYSYPVKIKRNHGMSRTVPAVSGRHVVTIGPKCHVFCLDAQTGECRWMIDMVRTFGTKVPPWYAGQCPLIDRGRAILAPAGKALMVAVDCDTGKLAWETPNPHAWEMTHSSVTPMEFKGRRMYVYCASRGVVGVSADDGAILWETPDWKISIANIPSPVTLGDGRIFLSGGYEAGCMMLQLKETNGAFAVETLWRLPAREFGATQQTPILFEGFLYGVRPDGQLACLSPEGKIVWSSGVGHRFGLGPFLVADGMLYVVNDEGRLSLSRATPREFALLAEAQVLGGHDSWGPLAVAGGRLLARDLTTMVCLDVSASVGGAPAK